MRSRGLPAAHVDALRAAVSALPGKTGVYRWLDPRGEVLYVGKAKHLRRRAAGYLSPGLLRGSPRHLQLAAKARSIDAILTPGGEMDALALEARMIARIKPPMNVLLKHAPARTACAIVGTLGEETPRFFALDDSRRSASGSPASRLGIDGVGGRVSPGLVERAAATARRDAARTMSREEQEKDRPHEQQRDPSGRTRSWLRPTRADALKALANLERALGLRALAFRATHGDSAARAELREAARVAAAVLDGGAAAEDAAREAEAAGDDAKAAALRDAARPAGGGADDESRSLAAVAALLAEHSANERETPNVMTSVDVVAAAASGDRCACLLYTSDAADE